MVLTREQFARALYQGLGRAILYARSHGAAPFTDLIVEACLHNPIYDRLTGVDRAPYLAELIAATGDEQFFRARILAALAEPDEEMDEELLFDLALQFAAGGDAAARRTMLARFLDNLSSGEAAGAHQVAALDGLAGTRFVVEQIGAALGRAVNFSGSRLPESLLADLEAAFADQPAVLDEPRVTAFRAAVRSSDADPAAAKLGQRRRELRERIGELSYGELRQAVGAKLLSLTSLTRWGKQAPDAELRRAADELLATSDAEQRARLLLIFDARDFPGGHAPLLPLLDRPEHRTRLRAANALSRFRHPQLRARALELLARADTLEYGLALLVGNHEPGDYAMLAARLQEPLDDDALHACVWRVHELFVRDPAPEAAELLLTLYELGPCAQCREKVVAGLLALDALPPHVAEECRFGANGAVRALVAGYRSPDGGT
jgi:hypothetical protein